MDRTTAFLTGFIVFCVSAVVLYGVYVLRANGSEPVIQSYMTGAFGIITGGAIALPVGYAIGKKKGEKEDAKV